MREQVMEMEERITAALGSSRVRELREDLEAVRRAVES